LRFIIIFCTLMAGCTAAVLAGYTGLPAAYPTPDNPERGSGESAGRRSMEESSMNIQRNCVADERQLPPIDLMAPRVTETAIFALG
jgi:hypothetical protein